MVFPLLSATGLSRLTSIFLGLTPATDLGNDAVVGSFLTRAELLVLNIAFHRCSLWFHRTTVNHEAAKLASTVILNLHRVIQPLNQEFLHPAMGCQRYLYKINLETASVAQFCSYILSKTREDNLLFKEMKLLVTLYIGGTLEDDGKDVQSLFGDILAVLSVATFSFLKSVPEATDSTLSLTKFILPNAELFLKELHTCNASVTLGDSQILTALRTMSEDKWIRI